MYFFQATLFSCPAVLLLDSKHDLASNSFPLWWPRCPPSTALQTLYPTRERRTCGDGPLSWHAGFCVAACWRALQTQWYWCCCAALSFLVGFWLAILMKYHKDRLFRKTVLHLQRSIYTCLPSQAVISDFTGKATGSWDVTVRRLWDCGKLRLLQELCALRQSDTGIADL